MSHPTSAARFASRRGHIIETRQPSSRRPPRCTRRSRSPLLYTLHARQCAPSHQLATSATDAVHTHHHSWVQNPACAHELLATTPPNAATAARPADDLPCHRLPSVGMSSPPQPATVLLLFWTYRGTRPELVCIVYSYHVKQ